jgi:hypothetical protein
MYLPVSCDNIYTSETPGVYRYEWLVGDCRTTEKARNDDKRKYRYYAHTFFTLTKPAPFVHLLWLSEQYAFRFVPIKEFGFVSDTTETLGEIFFTNADIEEALVQGDVHGNFRFTGAKR